MTRLSGIAKMAKAIVMKGDSAIVSRSLFHLIKNSCFRVGRQT